MPSREEIMATYMKYAQPGEHHKVLESLVGNWDCATKVWMEPGAQPNDSKGTSDTKWILGGRFVQEYVAGDMGGMPFHGMGIFGFDNYKQKYLWLWMDEMATSCMISTGSADAAGKVLTFEGVCDNMMTGKPSLFKTLVHITDNSKHSFEMHIQGPDGKLYKNFEVDYTRKK